MSDQMTGWINDPKTAWKFAMEWVEGAKAPSQRPVKVLYEAASKFKDRFFTNGMWSPGALQIHLTLVEAADMAQFEYDEACKRVKMR